MKRNQDTKIGGSQDKFPQTRWSAVVAVGSSDLAEKTRALDVLISAYWKPVYKYIRIKWQKSNEDAKDLTQGFFTRAMEKDFFVGFDPAKARFRTFLRTCLDRYVANEKKAAERQKRGGQMEKMRLDFAGAEGEINERQLADPASAADMFDQEWMRALFEQALAVLAERCAAKGKETHFAIFEKYDLADDENERPSYGELAKDFDLPVSQVTNYLAFTRRTFRSIILEKLREMTASEAEFRSEAQLLLGTVPE